MKNAWFSLIGLSFAVIVAGCAKGGSGGGGTGGTGGPCGTATQAQCNGVCIDVGSDSQNCGTCGYTCDVGQACQAGACVCATGFFSCSGMCVTSNTDHCGTTCMACSTGQVCSAGACSSAGCGSGSMMCSDGACSSNTDTGHCGTSCAVCPVGASCTNGTCGCTVASQQNCNGTCVDTSSSTGNCGSCGNACPFGDSCVSGACMGASTGGSNGNGGSGSGTGGTTGGGGSGAGGTSATGGSTGTGGSGTGTGGSTGTGGQSNQPVLVTSANNAFWKTNGTLSLASGNPAATVTVNDGTVKQNWEGFGGAFNELGWKYIQMLSASDQTKVLDLLFGTDAAHFAIGRIPIGASDYAINRYSEDETSGDTGLSHFSISQDMSYLIPYAQAAQKVNPSLRFWASPWTPPTWMKTTSGSVQSTNCTLVGSTMFDGGCMNASTSNLTTYAQYLLKFVQQYASMASINIDTISPQNEPSYAQGYPSCLWNPADYLAFVKTYLGPAFASTSTKIMLGTMSNGDNGQQSHDLIILNDVTGDGTAKGFEKVAGLQWGMLDIYEQNQSYITGASGIPFWATEHKCGNYPWNPSGYPKYVEPAPNDLPYGVESWGYIDKAIKAGVTSYNAWNMVLDTVGKGNDTTRQWSQDSLLVVNTSTKVLTITPAYYVFRHCAQYVQVGAKVVGTTGGDAIAWKNPDGSLVVVMYNSGGATTYTVSIGGKLVQFAMPGAGWATVMMPAGA